MCHLSAIACVCAVQFISLIEARQAAYKMCASSEPNRSVDSKINNYKFTPKKVFRNENCKCWQGFSSLVTLFF